MKKLTIVRGFLKFVKKYMLLHTSSATNAITRCSDTHIYDVGTFTVVATDACVFFAYNDKSSQITNKE